MCGKPRFVTFRNALLAYALRVDGFFSFSAGRCGVMGGKVLDFDIYRVYT